MRIGFDANQAFTNYSGLGNYSRYIISNIGRFFPENECFLYTPSIADPDLFHEPASSIIRQPGLNLGRFTRWIWKKFRLVRKLEEDSVDIFHGLCNEIPGGIQRTMTRSVITIHDLIYLQHPELYEKLERFRLKTKVVFGARNASRIIAVSEQTKEDCINLLGIKEEKIRVVYQGCHRQFYNRVSAETMKHTRQRFVLPVNYLLYVGTIEERKNLLKIIEAMHLGKIDSPLVVVGRKTAYFSQVKNYIEKNNINQVQFLDQVQITDLPAIYQGASGFIYPSSYEGFGIPILEALNSGVPVITSRGGCLEETAGKGGLLIDPYNREEMIQAMRLMLEDSEVRDRLIREGGSHAMKFREEQTIPELYKVYLECVNDGA